MTWFKVDDRLWGHPKWLASPAGARALWVTAGSWAAANLTDGRIPRHVLGSLGGRVRDADGLVSAGLWVVESGQHEGWRFADWTDYQPTREQVEADRAAAAERQQRARDKAKRAREEAQKADASRRDSRCESRVTYASPSRVTSS